MCLIPSEMTRQRGPHKLFRGDFGGKIEAPNGPFWATESLVCCFFHPPPFLWHAREATKNCKKQQKRQRRVKNCAPQTLDNKLPPAKKNSKNRRQFPACAACTIKRVPLSSLRVLKYFQAPNFPGADLYATLENSPAPYRPPIYNHLESDKNRRKSECYFLSLFGLFLAYFGSAVLLCPVEGRVVLNATPRCRCRF